MRDKKEFGLGLILIDEIRRYKDDIVEAIRRSRAPPPPPVPERRKVVPLERGVFILTKKNFTMSTPFVIQGDKHSMPIMGPGFLRSLIVIADSKEYKVTVVTDGRTILDDTYSNLAEITAELPRVAAYKKGDEYLVSIQDYPFMRELNAYVTPFEEITFSLTRAEVEIIS